MVLLAVPSKLDKIEAGCRNSAKNVSFRDLYALCEHYFGSARQEGTSHAVFKTPWLGDPRVNIQKAKGGKAKPYQVRQVLKAIDQMKESK